MSASFGCNCQERKKPVSKRAWLVWQRRCSRSAFNGYRLRRSLYSTVGCLVCGAVGRTRASYVDSLEYMQDVNETLEGFYTRFPDQKPP